jgi:hypothetical protein
MTDIQNFCDRYSVTDNKNLKFFKFKGQNRKNIVLYSFYNPFCRTCLLYSTRRSAPRALKNRATKWCPIKLV